MKKFTFILILILSLSNLIAQSPALINYQAVVRDVNGSLITSGTISLGISIHDAIVGGNQLYFETHNGITPNAFGVVNVLIGGGTVLSGNFLMINWGSGSKFLQVHINSNPVGSRTQMVSVPYSLWADKAGVADSARYAAKSDTSQYAKNVKGITTNNANSGQILMYNPISQNFQPSTFEYAIFNESLAPNVASSTTLISGSWATLVLNNTQYLSPGSNSISRNGNTITLQPGTYLVRAYSSITLRANGGSSGWTEITLRLKNLTQNTQDITGFKLAVWNTSAEHVAYMENIITVSNSSQNFNLEMLMIQPGGSNNTKLAGSMQGNTSNYSPTQIFIQKL